MGHWIVSYPQPTKFHSLSPVQILQVQGDRHHLPPSVLAFQTLPNSCSKCPVTGSGLNTSESESSLLSQAGCPVLAALMLESTSRPWVETIFLGPEVLSLSCNSTSAPLGRCPGLESFLVVLGIEATVLHLLGKHSSTELQPQRWAGEEASW